MLELVIYHQKIMTGLKWFWQVELEVCLKLSKVNASFLPKKVHFYFHKPLHNC